MRSSYIAMGDSGLLSRLLLGLGDGLWVVVRSSCIAMGGSGRLSRPLLRLGELHLLRLLKKWSEYRLLLGLLLDGLLLGLGELHLLRLLRKWVDNHLLLGLLMEAGVLHEC